MTYVYVFYYFTWQHSICFIYTDISKNTQVSNMFPRHLHLSQCCPSDAQQFWRRDLCRRRTTSLEQSAAQSQTMWAVIRPVQVVTEEIFIRTVKPWRSVNCFQLCQIEVFFLTYSVIKIKSSTYNCHDKPSRSSLSVACISGTKSRGFSADPDVANLHIRIRDIFYCCLVLL